MKLILSLAALSLVAAAAPAAAKPAHARGHGGFQSAGMGCPPGLAKKNNGCLPPGQAKKLNRGDRLPSYLSRYNVPVQYQDRYSDNRDSAYRYENNSIYRVDRRSGIIEDIISGLGF